jgi:hypothetical protein
VAPDVGQRGAGMPGGMAWPDGDEPGAGGCEPGEPACCPPVDRGVRPPPAGAVVPAPPHSPGFVDEAHLPLPVMPHHYAGDFSGDHQRAAVRGRPPQGDDPRLSSRQVELARPPALPCQPVGGHPQHGGAHDVGSVRVQVFAHGDVPAARPRQAQHAVTADQRRDTRPELPGPAVRGRPHGVGPQGEPASLATSDHQRNGAGRGITAGRMQGGRLPGAATIGRHQDQGTRNRKRGLRANRHHRAAGRGDRGERRRHHGRGRPARPSELPVGEPGRGVGHDQSGRAVARAGAARASDDDARHHHGEQRHADNGTHHDGAPATPGFPPTADRGHGPGWPRTR